MQQLFYTDYNGTRLPYVVREGKPLFPAKEFLEAAGYNKHAMGSLLSNLLHGEKVRVRRNDYWIADDTRDVLYAKKSGCRVMLTIPGVQRALRRLELGKGMPLLKHVEEKVLSGLEPSLLSRAA